MLQNFNQKVDQSRSQLGWSDTQILDFLGTKDPSLKQKVDQSRQMYATGSAPFTNDRDLVNWLSQKFSGQAPKVASNPDPSQQPGMVQSFAQGLAKPFLPLAAGAQAFVEDAGNLGAAALSKLSGNDAQANEFVKKAADAAGQQRDYGYLGKAYPIGSNQDTGQRITNTGEFAKQIGGEGAQIAAWMLPGGGEAAAEAKGLGSLVNEGKAATEGIKDFGSIFNDIRAAKAAKGITSLVKTDRLGQAALTGALMTGGEELAKKDSTLGSVLGKSVEGAAVGTAADVGLGLLGKGAKAVLSLPGRAVNAVVDKFGLSNVGDEVSKAAKSVAAQHSGLSIEQIDHIMQHPELYKPGALENVSRETLLKDVKTAFDESKSAFGDTGERYDAIRASQKALPIKMTENGVPDFVEKSLQQKYGVGLRTEISKSGESVVRLVTDKGSVPLSKSDRSALEEFLNRYARGPIKNGNEFMNVRQELSRLGNYKEIASGKTSAADRIAQTLRGRYNSKGKGIYDGLSELDAEWSAQKRLMDQWRPKLFDRNGNVKNSAYSTLANITNKSHVEDLKLFQQLMPDIADRAKVVGVGEKMTAASGALPGMYSRPLASGVALLSGHPFLAVANMFATPENFIKGIQMLPEIRQKYGDNILRDLFTNIQAKKPIGARGQVILKDIVEKLMIKAATMQNQSAPVSSLPLPSPSLLPPNGQGGNMIPR